MISNGEQTFTYDDVPNMVTVPDLAMSYEYDGYNRRTVTLKNGAIQKYSIYSASGQLLFEYNALTNKNTTHFYLGSQLITSKEVCSEVDTDGDGLSDCMEKQVGFDPEDPSDASNGADLDNDGLGNLLEISLGLDPTSPDDGLADNDGDGYSNRQEIWVGTNPNDSDSKPSLLPGETDFPGIRGWAMGIDAGSITGTSIAPDGSLYIGVQDKSDSSAVVNYLYHLGPGGNVIWNNEVSGLISKPPTVAMDGTVYVAAGENLYAINADGTEKWIIDGIHSNARASLGNDGSVYIASNKHTLMALDPETGVQRWKFPEDHSPFDINITEDIAVDGKGIIYLVASRIGLVSLTPEGELKSTYHYFSQPVIGIDGTLYISENNRLVAVDGDTGIEKWRFTHSRANVNLTSPVIDSNGTVIVGLSVYDLIALDAENGTIKWRKPPGGVINRPPTIGADNRIYVSVGDKILCFDESGELLWSHLIGNTVESSATLASDGTVYVSAGASVYAVVDDTSGLANSPWPYRYHDSAGSGNQCRGTDKIYGLTTDSDADLLSDCIEYVGGYDPQTAFDYPEDLDGDGLLNSEELDFGTDQFKSDSDYDGLSDTYEIEHQFNPLDIAEGLLDQDNDGFSNRAEMIAGSDPLLSTSKPEIGVPGKRRRIMRGEMIGIAHSKAGNVYMIYLNHAGSAAGDGIVSYREDGTYRWAIRLKNRPLGQPVVGSDGTIYVKTLFSDLLAISPEGKMLWKYNTLYYSSSELATAADGTVYIGTWYTRNELHAISPEGELKWKKNPPRRIYQAPVIDQKGVVYAGGETYITAYSSESEELWSKEYQVNGFTFNITGRMALSINGVLYVTGYVRNDSRLPEGYLLAIDTDTGKLIWTYKTLVGNNNNGNPPVSGSHSPVIGPDGTIYISYAKKPLYAISPEGKLKWTYQTSNNSSYLPPQIGKDGSIHTTKSSSFYHHQDIVILNPDGTERWSQTLPSAAKSFSYLTDDGVLNVLNARLDFSYRDTTCVWHMVPTDIGGKSDAPWPIVGQNELGNSQMASLAMVINSPLSGTASVTGDVVKLAVTAKDVTDGDLSASVTWRSSLDGDLGEGANLEVHLSPGIHQIWATIPNSVEKTISVPTMINVNQRPELSVRDVHEITSGF
ncbi:MAG: PQQ-binding-like beta-propeller repeat protein, partial [Exilibacterium sp.]